MGAVLQFPRAPTWHRVATPQGSIYDQAYEAMKTATDWPTRLGLAETLAHSPDWTHTALARHIRTAYSLHCEGLLKPINPAHRNRSDLVDQWKAEAAEREARETSVQIAMRYRPELMAIGLGVVAAVVIAAGFGWWVL